METERAAIASCPPGTRGTGYFYQDYFADRIFWRGLASGCTCAMCNRSAVIVGNVREQILHFRLCPGLILSLSRF